MKGGRRSLEMLLGLRSQTFEVPGNARLRIEGREIPVDRARHLIARRESMVARAEEHIRKRREADRLRSRGRPKRVREDQGDTDEQTDA